MRPDSPIEISSASIIGPVPTHPSPSAHHRTRAVAIRALRDRCFGMVLGLGSQTPELPAHLLAPPAFGERCHGRLAPVAVIRRCRLALEQAVERGPNR